MANDFYWKIRDLIFQGTTENRMPKCGNISGFSRTFICSWKVFVDVFFFFFVHVYVHSAREHYVKTVFVSPEYMMGTKPKMLLDPFETEYHD